MAPVTDHTCFEAELILLLPIVVIQCPHPHTLPCRLLVEGVGAAVGLAGVEGVAALIIGPLSAVGLPAVVAAHAGVGGKEEAGPLEWAAGRWVGSCIWGDAAALLGLQGSRGSSEQDPQLTTGQQDTERTEKSGGCH